MPRLRQALLCRFVHGESFNDSAHLTANLRKGMIRKGIVVLGIVCTQRDQRAFPHLLEHLIDAAHDDRLLLRGVGWRSFNEHDRRFARARRAALHGFQVDLHSRERAAKGCTRTSFPSCPAKVIGT